MVGMKCMEIDDWEKDKEGTVGGEIVKLGR